MNKTTTIYELLGMVKDGKQPKHIKYRGEEWWWGYDTYTYFSCLKQTPDTQINMFTKYVINYCLNDEVEIIEDNDKLEKIKWNEKESRAGFLRADQEIEVLAKRTETLKKKIAELVDHINKIEERLDEK